MNRIILVRTQNGEGVRRYSPLGAFVRDHKARLSHGPKTKLVACGTALLDRTGARVQIVRRGGKGNRPEARVDQESGDAARHLVQAKCQEGVRLRLAAGIAPLTTRSRLQMAASWIFNFDRISRLRHKALFGFFSRADNPPQLGSPCIEHGALPRDPCLKGEAIDLMGNHRPVVAVLILARLVVETERGVAARQPQMTNANLMAYRIERS